MPGASRVYPPELRERAVRMFAEISDQAHDAVAEVRYLATRPRCYDWVVEGDIKACFDEGDHSALMGRVRRRVGDNRALGLVKAFLKAGILTEAGLLQDSTAGTPQGGILSPLLANVALSVLDEHIAALPGGPASGSVERDRRLRRGQPHRQRGTAPADGRRSRSRRRRRNPHPGLPVLPLVRRHQYP